MRKIADLPERNECRDPSHEPPSMIVLKPGVYEHECPSCGQKMILVQHAKPSLESFVDDQLDWGRQLRRM